MRNPFKTPAHKARQPGRFKSALAGWLGKTIGLSDAAFWSAWGANSSSGQIVTADKALQVSAVWACVRLIAETIATLPMGFYQRTASGGRELATAHPLYNLLHNQPNADMSAVQFWEVVVASMLLWGNAYVEKQFSGNTLIALDFLLPQRMSVTRNKDGSLKYNYLDNDGKARIIPEDNIWHISAFSIDGVLGLSTICYGANVFGAAMSAEEASARIFQNGLSVGGVLSTDQILKTEQRDQLKTSMVTQFSGAVNSGKTMVLEAGMKYQQVSMNPEDAQLLATRAFNVEEICRWFRVPPFMVGHSEKTTSWGTGIEQQMIGFLTFALRPWLTRIEQAVRKSLLTPKEQKQYFAEFNVEGLLRADSGARAAYLAQMTQNGLMTRNEARAYDNRSPLPGGDALTVQSNLLPIDMLGRNPAPTTAKEGKHDEA
jgi:HK97 family phage portal protein